MFKSGDYVELTVPCYGYDIGKEFLVTSIKEPDDNEIDIFFVNMYPHLFKKVEKKQPFFSIEEGSIESAARFIVANNNYQPYANIQQCEESIKRCINRMVERIKRGEEAYRCSTAGWTVLIGLEDEDYYVVEVLCDPSVSQDREFVNVEEII